MKTVNIKINGIPVEVEEGTRILTAAKKAGVKIPTLCYHSDIEPWAACGICVVKPEGSPKMVRACATEVVEGQNYITHDPELMKVRRTVVELILSNHPNDCLKCARNGNCELQQLAEEFGIREIPYEEGIWELPQDDSTPSIVLDPRKCIKCGRCAIVCQNMQNVWALEFLDRGDNTKIAPAGDVALNESPCIKCGQCSAHCPVGAIYEKSDNKNIMKAIRDESKHVVVQVAPAVRVALGEAFGLEPGTNVRGKMYNALRRLGIDAVFDTNFSADLTIMEEASEFVHRLTEGGTMPMITTCCPAWVDYLEKYYPEMIPHFSTAKSPQMMQGAITKTYYAEHKGIDPKDIVSVSIMPCTAKKYEITRSETMYASGMQDVDIVLTTRELSRLIKSSGIDFLKLEDEDADSPIGKYSGAATIFGNTGGVMEAAIRSAYYFVTKKELGNLDVEAVRGMEGIKEGEVDVDGTKVRVAVAHGMKNVEDIIKKIKDAQEKGEPMPYDFIEVMACRGGCIAGGGQPYGTEDDIRERRIAGLYQDDIDSKVRCSHQNPEIKEIYEKFLKSPLSKKSHELLHTHYTPRPIYTK